MHVYTQDFERLIGQQIVSWIGMEMAVVQDEPLVWTDESCGFLQFFDLQVCFSDNTVEYWTARLDDDCNYYGLYLDESASALVPLEAQVADIFHTRIVQELPTGHIEQVKKHLDKYGQTVAVTLSMPDCSVTLWCGQILWEEGQYTVRRPWEFVLVEKPSDIRSNRSEQIAAADRD